MTMNVNSIMSEDLLFFLAAVAVAFALGCAHRIGRSIARQRRAVDLADKDLRDLSGRYELQQLNMSRLTRELSDVRQALMQQALAMAPVHAGLQAQAAAVRAPAAAPAAAPPRAATPRQAPAAVTARRSPPAPARTASAAVKSPPAAARTAPAVAASRPAAAAKPVRKPAAKPAAASPLELARRGASAQVLMARCGLSRSEAELVISVHGRNAGHAAA